MPSLFALHFACVGLLLACVFAWGGLALHLPLDYWDGFDFLLQARRLVDSRYWEVAFHPWRPRALVGILTGFDLVHRAIFARLPSLASYHLLMVSVTVAAIAAWWWAIARLWNRGVASLAIVFLLCCQLVHHYSAVLLADMLTMGAMGLYLALFTGPSRHSPWGALLVGAAGSLVGLGKYHYLGFCPLFLIAHRLVGGRARYGGILAGFLVTTEVTMRVFSRGQAGLWEHGWSIREQALHMIEYVYRPASLYLAGMVRMYGPVFWAMSVLSFVALARTSEIKHAPPERKAWLICVFVLAVLTQVMSQRELRYLLPLLPTLFAVVAAGAYGLHGQTSRVRPAVWAFVWAVALVHPAYRSWADLAVYREDPVYRVMNQDSDRFWAVLGDRSCERVDGCYFPLRARAWEFPDDQFYRSFDIGPHHYQFFSPLAATRLRGCDAVEKGSERYQSLIEEPLAVGTCAVARVWDPTAVAPYVALLRNGRQPEFYFRLEKKLSP